jgi:putative flippase GtrA
LFAASPYRRGHRFGTWLLTPLVAHLFDNRFSDMLSGYRVPARFIVIGFIGFIVDAGVLHVLVSGAGAVPIAGRVGSFFCASFVTWRLNRRYTFAGRSSGNGSFGEWLRYVWTSGVGAAVNYSVFAVLVLTLPLVADTPTLGVAAGSLAGMIVNFTLYKLVVFR